MTPRIEILVDELVVSGLAPGAARAVAAQLESRLAELAGAGAQPIAARSEQVRRLPAVEARAGTVGTEVAGAVWHAVSRGGGR